MPPYKIKSPRWPGAWDLFSNALNPDHILQINYDFFLSEKHDKPML